MFAAASAAVAPIARPIAVLDVAEPALYPRLPGPEMVALMPALMVAVAELFSVTKMFPASCPAVPPVTSAAGPPTGDRLVVASAAVVPDAI